MIRVPTTVSLNTLSASSTSTPSSRSSLCFASRNLQYMDYDTIQAYVELMMDSKDQTTRRNAFDRLWDYLMGGE